MKDTSFFAADLKCDQSKDVNLSQIDRILVQQDTRAQDVQLEDLMKVSFSKKTSKPPNDSSLSIKFGDCSVVGGALSDKSINLDDQRAY